jgi:hypothetical protein
MSGPPDPLFVARQLPACRPWQTLHFLMKCANLDEPMKILAMAGLLAIAPLAFAAEETRVLPEFTSISTQGVFKLVVTAGQPQAVMVSADDQQLANLSTTVVDGELVIAMPKKHNYRSSDKINITIGMQQLQRLRIEGVSETILNALAGENFQLQYQGVGHLTAHGKVKRLVVKAEGVGSINARNLEAQSVDATVEGIGSVSVRASESLKARVEGLGSLTYYGKPAQVSKSAEGIGSIRAAE